MRREPLPGPADEDGQDSDTENVDFAIETDPSMVTAPCPGVRAVLQHSKVVTAQDKIVIEKINLIARHFDVLLAAE